MSLATQMVADVTTVFLSTSEHAETFTHTPAGSTTATTYTGIIERGEAVLASDFADGLIRKVMATIETATNGVATTGGPASVKRGEKIVFDNLDWRVAGRGRDDGCGMQIITVERPEIETLEATQGSIRRRG